MADVVLNSADSHLQEPGDLWTTRLPHNLREIGPRREVGDEWTVRYIEGKERTRYKTLRREDGSLLEDASSVAPDIRLKDLDRDGVWAETLYPSIGLACHMIGDPELALASARVYNDYIAEIYTPYRHRLCPIAVVPMVDIPAAIAEIERIVSLGLRGISLPMIPPNEPYFHDAYDAVWSVAQACSLPVSFHAGTGLDKTELLSRAQNSLLLALWGGQQAVTQVATLVGSGVLERFSELHVIMVEVGAGFLAWVMQSMDDEVAPPSQRTRPQVVFGDRSHESQLKRRNLSLMPSEYVRRQVHVTFMHDPPCLANIGFTGTGPLLWGSDYPHPEGTYPYSREVTNSMFERAGVDDEVAKSAILGGTVAKLYGFEMPQPATILS